MIGLGGRLTWVSLNDRTWIATPEDEVGWRDGGLQRELGMYGAVLQNANHQDSCHGSTWMGWEQVIVLVREKMISWAAGGSKRICSPG